MNLTRISIGLIAAAFFAGQSPKAAHAQAGAFPVEETTIADIEAAYMSGRTTTQPSSSTSLCRYQSA